MEYPNDAKFKHNKKRALKEKKALSSRLIRSFQANEYLKLQIFGGVSALISCLCRRLFDLKVSNI